MGSPKVRRRSLGFEVCAGAEAIAASCAAPGVTDRTATPTVILCAWGMEFDSCVQVCTSPRPPRRLVGPITGSSGLGPRGVRLRPRNPFSHQQKHQNKGIRKWICGISLGNTHRRTRGSMLELCVLTVVSPRGGEGNRGDSPDWGATSWRCGDL